jgi:putative transposase
LLKIVPVLAKVFRHWYGLRQMANHLRREGYQVGRKRVRRLMSNMGLAPIYQRPRTTVPHPSHRI